MAAVEISAQARRGLLPQRSPLAVLASAIHCSVAEVLLAEELVRREAAASRADLGCRETAQALLSSAVRLASVSIER